MGVSGVPRGYVAGPVHLDGLGLYWMEPVRSSAADRGAARAEVFLSELRLARRPVAALPLRGFWDTEVLDSGSTYANWLNARAAVEVVSADPALPRAWVAFDVTSVDRERTLTVSAGGRSRRISVPERGSSRRVVLGPLGLRRGRALLELASPDPARYASDQRRRSVYVSDLQAFTARPAG